ncbi:MAG: hybrid sensor histidine kinase/response regulator [Lachnospiraceae bacterium]|nr:hybrid sensor histidine kinase/response regulator [Lachnospiraceae bacterium]
MTDILIVEDDRAISHLIAGTLKREGFRCVCAMDGEEGLARFDEKAFDLVLLLLTATLSFAEYYTVSSSFENAMSRQTDDALRQHQIVKYALRSNLLTMQRNSALTQEAVEEMAEQTAESLSVTLSLTEAEENAQTETLVYSISETGVSAEEDVGENGAEKSRKILTVVSSFAQGELSLTLRTEQDISNLFQESETLQQNCQLVFLAVECIGAVAALLLTWYLTRPVGQLERAASAFSAGDYASRATVRSGDEIGDLARSFNEMADSMEDKIQKLELSARQKESFTASFAHELKTPMTSIIGYADTLYQKELPQEQVREAAGYILNEGLRLEALSFKLMELFTLERQDYLLEVMEAGTVFHDVEQSYGEGRARDGVELYFLCEPGCIRIEYDLFKTLLLNLIDNALKSGGSSVMVLGRRSGKNYLIQVTDDGRGIPASEISRITEAFYMVDNSGHADAGYPGVGRSSAAGADRSTARLVQLKDRRGRCSGGGSLQRGV